jgi:hypothetical protein
MTHHADAATAPDRATMATAKMVGSALVIAMLVLTMGRATSAQTAHAAAAASSNGCAGDGGGITLPPGFCATVFADHLGHARHIVVAPNGVVYVNTWSGRYFTTTRRHLAVF